ncbi:MAG: YncE family protein [Rhodanobacteraceae bacterium]
MTRSVRGCGLAAVVLAAAIAGGDAAAAQSFQLQSETIRNLQILYTPDDAYLVPYTLQSFENSLRFQEKTFHWTPWDRPTIVLTDLSDYGNGGTSVAPFNEVSLYIAPSLSIFGTEPSTERMYSTANHELVHAAQMDGWNGRDAFWRKFLGGKLRAINEHPETILYSYLTTPRTATPRWWKEGIAVYMETWMAGGIGRAQGPYDEMVFRAMVRDHTPFYSPLGLVSVGTAVDFENMTNAYLYGTRFITWLSLQYSPQKVVAWYTRSPTSKAYYTTAFKQVFGITLDQAWREWVAFEHTFQEANLARIRKYPVTHVTPFVPHGLGSVSRYFIDGDKLIAAFSYPGKLPYIGVLSLKDGTILHVVDVKGAIQYLVTSTAYDPATHTLFYTQNNTDYRDLMEVDIPTGKVRMLQKGARIGDLAFDAADRSLWGLRTANGYVTLVKIPYPYKTWHDIHTYAYGMVPSEVAVSHDGKLLSFSMNEPSGANLLEIYKTADLLDGGTKPFATYSFGQAAPEGFVFSADDKQLYGSSYYTGISNIYRYDLATGKMDAMSNAETGFFRPVPLPDGKLAVLEYTGLGFRPGEIDARPLNDLSAIKFLGTEVAEKHPIVKTWGVGSPTQVNLASLNPQQGVYRPGHELRLQGHYPVVEGYRGGAAVGWHTRFGDTLSLYSLDIDTAVSVGGPTDHGQRLHLDVDYKAMNWEVRYWHNHADFYDLFGPFRTSLKGDSLWAGYKRALILDIPRRLDFSASAAYYTGLATLPGFQNVNAHVNNIFATHAGLKYANIKSSAGAVDREQGLEWNLDATTYVANGKIIPQLRGGFDFGFMLPVPHMSLWLYNAAGASGGSLDNSLANFYFGGFQNNFVDNENPKHYRDFDSLPGFEIDAIAGHTFAKSTLELNLPPLRFENVGSPGLFLRWLRPALFTEALVTDPDRPDLRATQRDIGAQVDLEFEVLSHLTMTLSAGYAKGYGAGGSGRNEWMISLKIL